jgi:hypothetical protein
MATGLIHNKQWFISKTDKIDLKLLGDSFAKVNISESIWLFHHKNLHISKKNDKSGNEHLILGFLLSDSELDQPTYFYPGRFMTISQNWMTLDGTGTLGVFYNTSPSPDLICTSSCSLISYVFKLSMIQSREFLLTGGLNYNPAPLARLQNFKRLFIDQEYNLLTGEFRIRESIIPQYSVEKSIQELHNYMLETASRIKDLDRPVFLALTAGNDSRAIFSSFIKAGVVFETFTNVYKSVTSIEDAKIAKKISNQFGIKHNTFEASNSNNVRMTEEYLEHVGGVDPDKGLDNAKGDFYRQIPDDSILIHGGGFEIGRREYQKNLDPDKFESRESMVTYLSNKYKDLGTNEIGALSEWYDHRINNLWSDIDFLEYMFIDQRRASWGADNRLAEDYFNFNWIIFSNSWKCTQVLLSTDVSIREKNIILPAVMEKLVPGITSLAEINPQVSKVKIVFSLLYDPRIRLKLKNKLTKLFK